MRSTFFGFEIAKTGIQSAQLGLDVTGQNISKMNAKGYSRQMVDQSTVYFASTSYKFALSNTENLAQGVSIDRIAQIRDDFLDNRYRSANSEASAINKTLSILSNISNVIDETLSDGLSVAFEEFYDNLQVLSANTGDIEYSSLLRSSAQKLTETINYYNKQFNTIKEQEMFDLDISVTDINSLLKKIDKLNSSIQYETLQKNITNDLLDARNNILDELSSYINISVESNADGTINVKTGSEYLIDAENGIVRSLSLQNNTSGVCVSTEVGELDITSGSLIGYMEAINGYGSYANAEQSDFKGIPYYQNILDDLANSFATVMNDLNGVGKPLFSGTTADTIAISEQWINDANFITTTTDGNPTDGKNDNILRMIQAMDSDIAVSDHFTGTFSEFIVTIMTDIAIDENYFSDLNETANTVLSSIDNQRESIKGVSLNEETVNLIKYQKAFEASARVVTALDEMLDTIINRMGVVGR